MLATLYRTHACANSDGHKVSTLVSGQTNCTSRSYSSKTPDCLMEKSQKVTRLVSMGECDLAGQSLHFDIGAYMRTGTRWVSRDQ